VTWWQWTLAVLLAAAGIAFGGFRFGVLTQRKDDADARLRLAVQVDSSRQAHAAALAALNVEMVSRATALTLAEARAAAADRKAVNADVDRLAALDNLKDAQTAADSLAAYPPVVDALTRQLVAVDSSRLAYRDALTASQERSALLLRRITADSAVIVQLNTALGKVIPPPPPSKSGWGCVAGVGAVTGARTGLGFGVTCGRKL
jgi:hypothetical protein